MSKISLRMAVICFAVLTAIVGVCARIEGLGRSAAAPSRGRASGYDIVIANGRVMDPESGLDAVRNLGISGGKIRAISVELLKGTTVLDAKGLVVAPGFIDLHEHAQEPRNYQFQAHDGVTTSLELEVGTDDVDAWYAKRESKSLINFGVSAGHIPVRMKVMHDPGNFLPTGDAAHREATPQELEEIKNQIRHGLQSGALGRGHGASTTPPAASHDENRGCISCSSSGKGQRARASPSRRLKKEPTTGLVGIDRGSPSPSAAATGAPLHVVHITSRWA